MSNYTPPSLFLIRVVFYGGSFVLAGFVWAWALDANIWYGVVPGAALGLVAGLILGTTSKTAETGGLESLIYLLGCIMVVALPLALSIIGGIVGLVIRLVT